MWGFWCFIVKKAATGELAVSVCVWFLGVAKKLNFLLRYICFSEIKLCVCVFRKWNCDKG